MENWNTPYNSELTTIKNKAHIKGFINGIIVAVCVMYLIHAVM